MEQFLVLLTASPAERDRMLEERPADARSVILARIREYEALSPAQREKRLVQLRLAQFRFYLSPLLRATAEERFHLLQRVPDDDRLLLLERLKRWDAMTEAARAEVLESDRHFQWFMRQPSMGREQFDAMVASLPERAQRHLQGDYSKWASLSPAERAARTAGYQRIFDLTAEERETALTGLSERDRKLMAHTLNQYERLSREKKEEAIRGFARFVGLTEDEQKDFMVNALQWQAMTVEERAAWRRLVMAVPPPPLPPLPGGGGGVPTNR